MTGVASAHLTNWYGIVDVTPSRYSDKACMNVIWPVWEMQRLKVALYKGSLELTLLLPLDKNPPSYPLSRYTAGSAELRLA